jgi:hypothetical protein
MKLKHEKKAIYILLAFFTAICGLPWVQLAYNDPATVMDMSTRKIGTLVAISLCYVIAQTLIAWKAYLSDPNEKRQNEP